MNKAALLSSYVQIGKYTDSIHIRYLEEYQAREESSNRLSKACLSHSNTTYDHH